MLLRKNFLMMKSVGREELEGYLSSLRTVSEKAMDLDDPTIEECLAMELRLDCALEDATTRLPHPGQELRLDPLNMS